MVNRQRDASAKCLTCVTWNREFRYDESKPFGKPRPRRQSQIWQEKQAGMNTHWRYCDEPLDMNSTPADCIRAQPLSELELILWQASLANDDREYMCTEGGIASLDDEDPDSTALKNEFWGDNRSPPFGLNRIPRNRETHNFLTAYTQ